MSSSTNRNSDRHRPGQMYRAITSSSDTSCMHGIPTQKALIFDKGDILVCRCPPRSTEGFILGYLEGTRHMGFAGEGLFHPDQVVMVEDSGSSSVGAGAGANRGSSHSASAGSVASDARRRANGDSAAPSPRRGGGGRQQLYVAKTSSAESWSKYKIQDPRLQFDEGDHLVSERVSRTTGEHFGYVVDTKYPAKEKRPCPDKSKGYFHPEQVQIVEDSSAPSIRDSTVRSNPEDKNKSTNAQAAAGAGAADGGALDKDALLSRGLSSKRRKIGRESANGDMQLNRASVEAKLSQSLSAKRDVGNEQGRDTKACTSQNLSASKRPSDPGTSSGPLHEEDTDTKLSRGLSAKRIKRSDSAASSTSESNNSGLHAKMLGGRFQPPQREQPPSNAAKRKVETIKPDQARAMVAKNGSSRSIASFSSTNAKASAKSDMDEAKCVQVPTAMAMKSRFPPGCVAVHTSDDGSTNAYTICSVHLKLSSDELVSGRSNFDVLFKVGTGENEKFLSEESLVYARDCPIFIKSYAVPHVKSQSGWVPATVKSSMKLPGALEEDYVVTIANGGTAHVPRDTVHYRSPTLSENTDVSTSIEHAKPPSVSISVPDPAPPVAVVVAPAPTSTTETASTESVTEDVSNGSSSLARDQKKVENASATIVCRIDVPDRLAFGTVQKLLSPKIEPMKKRLKVEMFVVGSDNPPPRDAGIVRSFGDIFPRPLPSGVYSSSILISGQAKNTEKARKAIIFFLKEGVDDGESLDKDLEAGCSKARAITNSAKGTDSAAASANASSVSKSRETGSENSKPTGKPASKPSPPFSTKQFVLPKWLKYVDIDTFFESSKKKETESKILCSIRLVNRIAPIELELTNNDPAKDDFCSEWCTLTERMASCLDANETPLFIYQCMRENSGKTVSEKYPVLDCRLSSERSAFCVAIPLIDSRYASFIIGSGGVRHKRVEAVGCRFHVYDSSLAGGYAFIESSKSRDIVKTARGMIEGYVAELSEKLARNNAITQAFSQHTAEYRLPVWISYDDVSGFFEGSQGKKFERQSGVSIEISNQRSPINIALSSSISQDLWNEWESLTSAISWTIDEDMRPRFLYDVIMYNYGGKMERKHSPVLTCQSPFDSEERLLMAVLSIPTRPQGSYAGYIVGSGGMQGKRIKKIDCTFDVYEFPLRQDLSYVLVTGAVRSNVKTARDIVQEKIEECHDLREIEMDDGDDEDEGPQVIYQPPSNDLEDEEEDDEPEVVFRPQRPQEGKRTIQILSVGVFIGNDWAQVKRWQSKFGRRGVKISVRVSQSKADVSGPEHELDSVVREINSWQQRSQRPSTPPRRQPRRTSDVVFGGVVM